VICDATHVSAATDDRTWRSLRRFVLSVQERVSSTVSFNGRSSLRADNV